MSGLPWSKFFWRDYEADEAVKQCSFAGQGLWMRMLCLCAKGDPYGYLSIAGVALDAAGLSTAVGRPEAEVAPLLAELDRWGVFSRDRKGRIYSRRMVRAEQKANIGRKFATRRWAQDTEKPSENQGPNGVAIGVPMTQKPEARSLESKEEERGTAQAPLPEGYSFYGRIIRLKRQQFDDWRRTYHGIPDIVATLHAMDAYYDTELEGDDRKRWFIRCSTALDKKHQEAVRAKALDDRPHRERYPNEGLFRKAREG